MPRVTQPKQGEPIRLTTTKSGGHKYEVTLTSTPAGSARRKQIRRRFDTLGDARRFVDQTRTEVRSGTFTPTDTTTLRQLAEQWLADRRDVREVTVQGYRQALAPILRDHGERRAQSITRSEVSAWVDSWPASGGLRGQGLSHRSVVLALQALRQVLRHGVESGTLAANPAESVRAPRKRPEDHHKIETWTVEQLRRFLTVADQDRLAAAWRLSACGLRRSEVLGLSWSAVDLEAGTVEVKASRVKVGHGTDTSLDAPKSAASRRTVPVERIMPGTVAALRRLRAQQAEEALAALGSRGSGDGLVVVDEAGGPVQPDRFGNLFRGLCDNAGLPVIPMHNLRHTVASALHEAGEAPAAVARLLGHEVSTHLSFYVASTDDAVTRAAVTFGQVLGSAGEG